MDGDEQDPQLLIGQHHGEIGGAGMGGQNLGMAGVVDARRLHRLLVQGRGDDGIDLAGLGQARSRARHRHRRPRRPAHRCARRGDRAGSRLAGSRSMRPGRASASAGVAMTRSASSAPRSVDGAMQDRLIADDEGRRQAALGPELDDDLGTDAGRIAHGDCNRWGSRDKWPLRRHCSLSRPPFRSEAKSRPAAPPGLSLGPLRAGAGSARPC